MTDITFNYGKYGCVFHPAFLPNNSDIEYKNIMKYLGDPFKYVTKFLDIKDAMKEIKLSEQFMKIDPDNKFLIYPLNYIVKKVDITDRYIDICKNTNKDIKDFVSLYIPYGGTDIYQWIDKHKDNNILRQLSVMTIFIQTLEGLLLLHKNNIVHLDIKPENFLISEIKDTSDISKYLSELKLRYIDFGLSNDFKVSDPEIYDLYMLWPFDFIIVNRLRRYKNKGIEIVETIDANRIYETYWKPPGLTNSSKYTIYNDVTTYISKYTFEDYYKLVDIYMLGTFFYHILNDMKIKQSTLLTTLINGMRNHRISERYNDDKLRLMVIDMKIQLLETEKKLREPPKKSFSIFSYFGY